ncbi:PEPxxWA-CTERM sorting domain-containing protein [Sphingomonas sp. KR1UV-12]|uniref:PEPxxWA-CTERM sorting domain-containing protein n=1 Tax=Sphingomonas aurea TaxID=3063994 RepID=A0ABT9EIR5_9SPHN|nr:PEPxxWA-CTERM sorting domain-containing protein [Sphingomonas sp. KR1UV-12]MDP1026513.1 PEPxxWA-CTERM sorting domain-containing protein [Sphingomonas sp. KR1UV-12]
MRLKTIALAASALCVMPSAANAAVTATLGSSGGTLVSLSQAGLNGGAVATLSGGTVYTNDRPFADMPAGTIFGNAFLAVGPTAGQPATLTFTNALTYLSFLWGSPDTYNQLTLTTNQRSYTYTANSLGFTTTDGNQSISQAVQFAASAGETISSISFNNSPAVDAFETANYRITAVPEPATWAMLLVGFGMVGAASRYRRRSVRAAIA